jgi:dTDP-4-amino-4,6-dideoxygalactose transaminase
VRRRVPLRQSVGDPLERAFAGFTVHPCASGTQALALAIKAAAATARGSSKEILLPAYGCPDLVAACVFAGARARLVDTAPGQWGYDFEQLRAAISHDTAAIVAVNLLGSGDQASALRELTRARDIALIQDSAQHLPQSLPATWLGDYVILSFGRGKPLNLLGGGLLLSGAMSEPVKPPPPEWNVTQSAVGLLFNIATDRRIYGLSSRILGTRLGETRYKPLQALEDVSPARLTRFAAGVADYRAAPGYDAGIWAEACREWAAYGVAELTCAEDSHTGALRLRLALLARDHGQREAIVRALTAKGIGASRMYNATLPALPGVPTQIAAQGPFLNANELAQRLFTLPTHSQVTAADVRVARDTLRRISR